MNEWLLYLLLNGIGVLLFIVGYLCARLGKRWQIIAAGVILLLILSKSVLTWMPVWEATLFPFSGYIYFQSFWMPFLMMAFFGVAAPQLAVPWNRAALAGIAGILYVYLGVIGTWWMVSRTPIGSDTVPNAQHHLKQSTMYTCAPCAAAMAVSYIGQSVSERQMADYCLTVPQRGTTRFNTFRGLMISTENTPWTPRMAHASVAALCRDRQVTVIDFPDIRHAITVVGNGMGVTLHDPLHAKPLLLDAEDLAERYGGVAILLEKRSSNE